MSTTLPRRLLGGLGLPAGGGARLLDGLDAQEAERHLLALAGAHGRQGVDLLLLREHRGPEHVHVHVEEPADLGVDVGRPGGQAEVTDVQLRFRGRPLAAEHPADLVLLPAVLEHHADLAVREKPLGADLLLLRASRVDAEAGEADALHEGGLPAPVLAEDPDHLGGELQVHLLEHAVVPERELEDPHTTSPLASWRNRVPIDTTRSRSRPARSCIST
jgi:hypothetical protein